MPTRSENKKAKKPFFSLENLPKIVFWFSLIATLLLLALVGTFVAFIIGSQEMGDTTLEMRDMTREMLKITKDMRSNTNDLKTALFPLLPSKENIVEFTKDIKRLIPFIKQVQNSTTEWPSLLKKLALSTNHFINTSNVILDELDTIDFHILIQESITSIDFVNQRIPDYDNQFESILTSLQNTTNLLQEFVTRFSQKHKIEIEL